MLEYASEDLKKDPEFAFAVKQNGNTVFASEDLKKDPEIVLSAVKQNGLHCITHQRS